MANLTANNGRKPPADLGIVNPILVASWQDISGLCIECDYNGCEAMGQYSSRRVGYCIACKVRWPIQVSTFASIVGVLGIWTAMPLNRTSMAYRILN